MSHLLATIALRTLGCIAVAFALSRVFDIFGWIFCIPLLAAALARPLLDLLAELRRTAKAAAYAQVQGQHYAYRGMALSVAEDDDHHRWISLKDVHKVLPALPRAAVLQKRFPHAVNADLTPAVQRIRADALRAYLAQATEVESLRFRQWLDTEVIFPATVLRARLGIRDAPPGDAARAAPP